MNSVPRGQGSFFAVKKQVPVGLKNGNVKLDTFEAKGQTKCLRKAISKQVGGQNVQERQFNGHIQASGQPKCPL